jgi:nuclear mRNA export protein SAC3
MVKRYRRSAAGDDEQLPSDIRTPATLKRSLDYLLNDVVGGEDRLATVQKFVWDRTRAIRNDFSIQQVTSVPDVKLAVECYERIARFHILCLHQLSNPDNLWDGEHFDAYQENEQLNNTLLTLMYAYDDHRDRVDFPNEPEFRAYLVIFEIASMKPDTEDRMQSWPKHILGDERVKTALKLYKAAGDTMELRGPLKPYENAPIAQANGGSFWKVLASKSVPYIMACLAELYFQDIRFATLDAIWRSCKQQPQSQQARRDWTLSDLTDFLGFDSNNQTKEFCEVFDLSFVADETGEGYLDPKANVARSLNSTASPLCITCQEAFLIAL